MRFAISVAVLWLMVAGAARGEVSGVYVNRDHTCQRVEFLPGGKCFVSLCSGYTQGKYAFKENTYICTIDDDGESTLRLQVQGETLVDEYKQRWVRREDFVKIPWDDLSTVTMVVVDASTREPIREFTYSYSISAPDGDYDPMPARPFRVASDDGAFTIQAPPSCEIGIRVEARDLVRGYGTYRAYDLTTSDTKRRIEVEVETGVTVRGVVVAADTGQPLEGARVSPVIFTPPLFSPDTDRSAKTNAKGEFIVHGVEPALGIHASHPDYFELEAMDLASIAEETGEGVFTAKIELQAGECMSGVVKDPTGKPIPGVAVSDGAGKKLQSGQDGSFVLKSPKKWWNGDEAYYVNFEKEGYIERTTHPKTIDPRGLSIVLQPCPVITGQVLDPQGRAVSVYEVFAGPEREPGSWQCSSSRIDDRDGRFSLSIESDSYDEEERKAWIGVKAPGYAMWDTCLDAWRGTTSLTVRLERGVAVRGKIQPPKSHKGAISAKLLPRRPRREWDNNDLSQRQILGSKQTTVDKDGVFRFANVKPGQYSLSIFGSGISPVSVGVVVPDVNLDVGTFSPQGTGTVFGQVHKPDGEGVWAFADGTIDFTDTSRRSESEEFPHLKPLSFKAGENGRFRVDGVPAGEVCVSIPYWVLADVMDAHSRIAHVVEGKATEVRFFDPSGAWDAVFEFVIGDGSPAHFASGTGLAARRKVDNVTKPDMFSDELEHAFFVDLRPIDPTPISHCAGDWEVLDAQRRIRLPDVQPGRYHLRIIDWQGSRGFDENIIFETDLVVKPGRPAVKVPLGAGCVTGAIRWSKDYRHRIHVIAVGKKAARPRHARCDTEGNFCVRCLPADDYVLYAHDYDAGWCRLTEVAVRNNAKDVGVHRLSPGGTIAGQAVYPSGSARATEILATDSRGISIDAPDFEGEIGEAFSIAGLWPGVWTVTLRRGEDILAKQNVTLTGTETIPCNIGLEN